jgi:lauroyl/myristoyl acyltransferase
MPGLRDRLIDAGYGLGWSVVCRAPESWARWAFMAGAEIAWRRQGPRVQVLEANLRRVLGPAADGGELRALSRQSMRSYARYWLEVFRLPVIPVKRLVDGMYEEGSVQIAFDYVAAGRGVVFALPHMGNWDQAAAWIIASGAGSFTTVAERLKPEAVYERFVAFRENLGMEVLPASGGSRPFGVLAQRLRAGRIVCLPCDRDVTGNGIEVEFFGEKAHMMAGPAALAVQTGRGADPGHALVHRRRLGSPLPRRDPGAGRGRHEAADRGHDAADRARLRGRHQRAPGGLAHAADRPRR